MSRSLALGFAAALLLVAASPEAQAHTERYPSKILRSGYTSSSGTVTNINGVVKNKLKVCRLNRQVDVFALNNSYGSDLTDSTGYWEINGSQPTGQVYTYRVTKMVIGSGAHKHVCKAGSNYETLS